MKKVYKGRCAKCGVGKKSISMLARPAGMPIPDDVSEVLPFVSQTNCRCLLCLLQDADGFKEKER